VRVAGAVQALVVLEHGGGDRLLEGDAGEHLVADLLHADDAGRPAMSA
jgi:hypothetical protein